MAKFQTCFVNTEDKPKNVRHVAFYTVSVNDEMYLLEVVVLTYSHPEAPDAADIDCISTRFVHSVKRHSEQSGPLVLLEAVQNNTRMLYGNQQNESR